MSLEIREDEENNSPQQSESKASAYNKSHRIRKSPKPTKKPSDSSPLDKKDSIFSSLRLTPQFGVFESEVQKQMRLEKFWREEIDNYYRKHITEEEKDLLRTVLEQEVPSLQAVVENSGQVLPQVRVPFEELYRYVELIHECRAEGRTFLLVEHQDKHFLGLFQETQLEKLIEVTQQQGFLLSQRQKFLQTLQKRQQQYNALHHTNEQLSQISCEIAFLLFLMKTNKLRINQEVQQLQTRLMSEPTDCGRTTQMVEDRYISCLIRKNLKLALADTPVDFLNYYANLDAIEQYGSLEADQERSISDRREFDEYMKRKRSKKTRKNPKGVLKTVCCGCLSPHNEQYNPFQYCIDCHVRFHKYCYSVSSDGLCEPCSLKKGPQAKGRLIECQLCPNRGLLSLPVRSMREGVSIHIFCMLINGLWKFQGGCLEFKSANFMSQNIHNDLCSICNSSVYTYQCQSCSYRAHPLCAFLNGWNMWLDEENAVRLECCHPELDKEKQSYRRKFVLNYKKMLFKSERER